MYVTATAHIEMFDTKIRSRSDVAPKHVKGERPARNRTTKAEVSARGERAQETTEKTSIPSVKHGIVPIPGRLTLL